MNTDANGAGGLPSETNCPSHDEEIVVTSKNFEAGFIAGMKFCETHFHDGELCRATREGDGEVGVLDSHLTGIANHIRACPEYRKLLGDAEYIERAAALLRTLSRVAVQEGMVMIQRMDAERLARFGLNNAGNGLRSSVRLSAMRVSDCIAAAQRQEGGSNG